MSSSWRRKYHNGNLSEKLCWVVIVRNEPIVDNLFFKGLCHGLDVSSILYAFSSLLEIDFYWNGWYPIKGWGWRSQFWGNNRAGECIFLQNTWDTLSLLSSSSRTRLSSMSIPKNLKTLYAQRWQEAIVATDVLVSKMKKSSWISTRASHGRLEDESRWYRSRSTSDLMTLLDLCRQETVPHAGIILVASGWSFSD